MFQQIQGDDMHPLTKFALPLFSLALFTQDPSQAQERDRSKIADQYKWNLTDLYPSDAAWKEAKQRLTEANPATERDASIPALKKYKGTLGTSAQQLAGCLNLVTELRKEFDRLYSYASMSLDQDTKIQSYLGMQQEMSQLGASFSAEAAFIEPEILKIDPAKVQGFIKSEKKLEIYKHYLDDILRRKAHTGTEGEEKIIADAGLMSGEPYNIHSIFANADFPYPEVTLSDGKTVKLDAAGFALQRTSANREDRKKVFAAFMGKLNDFRRTSGTLLNAQVKTDLFSKNARKYNSCLESALDANNIPIQVYQSLVDNVNKNLSTFHRYLKLRQRILGVDQLHYYDLYAPLLKDVDLHYTYEEAQQHILAALKPLGSDYTDVLKKGFAERWLDVYPTEGKRSGAYSNGSAYDVHPYMLLNYNGKYDDMSTVAHEFGHSMQSYLSNKNQPYATSQYPIFVAEVASTFNEALLIDYMLKQIKDDNARLSLLGSYIENIKGTVFRQTQFAEFELRIHEMAEKGEPLTGDVLNKVYEEIVKKYYGHDKNVCIVDDEIKAEWMYIPHFYYNFYVYQYATSFTASAALSERTIAGDQASTKKYLQFLSSGGSDYPIALLKKAGVDMTTSEPFELTMNKMNRVIDEMEKILDKKK
ncbi:MAG: oligoendopeptidase F [Ignavibacteriae bacterium]|nr:MAG: oligoendopeptidase F [Ignavibacteriota bacterium]